MIPYKRTVRNIQRRAILGAHAFGVHNHFGFNLRFKSVTVYKQQKKIALTKECSASETYIRELNFTVLFLQALQCPSQSNENGETQPTDRPHRNHRQERQSEVSEVPESVEPRQLLEFSELLELNFWTFQSMVNLWFEDFAPACYLCVVVRLCACLLHVEANPSGLPVFGRLVTATENGFGPWGRSPRDHPRLTE